MKYEAARPGPSGPSDVVDRIGVTLEFHSREIDDSVLDDLVKFILGRDNAFLLRAPLAGIHGARSR